MRIIHTADWHLGKRMEQHERTEEHKHFLNWLIDTINNEQAAALIIAGDIFDTGTPSNAAFRLYYEFLSRLQQTTCRDVIIIGGNHDSIATLNAPRDLLRFFNVHVIGGVPENPAEQLIELKDETGALQAVVAAVPFIRDKDVRLSVAGESPEEQERRLKEGIIRHYTSLVPLLEPYKEQGIPLITTGHLFAQGGVKSDDERDIHIGNLGKIAGDQFPVIFDYVALGHLHRPQVVGGLQHIRYSGSPIPLDFSERKDEKQVLLLDVQPGVPVAVTPLPVPGNRKMIELSGTFEAVLEKIGQVTQDADTVFPPWLDIQVQVSEYRPDMEQEIQDAVQHNSCIGFFRLRMIQSWDPAGDASAAEPMQSLSDLEPMDVLDIKCTEEQVPDADREALSDTFREALELMHQQENE